MPVVYARFRVRCAASSTLLSRFRARAWAAGTSVQPRVLANVAELAPRECASHSVTRNPQTPAATILPPSPLADLLVEDE